jgi:hypothetical protein
VPTGLSAAALEAAVLAAARERMSAPLPRRGHHTVGALGAEESDEEGVDVLGHINKAPSLNVRRCSVAARSVC